MEQLELFPMVYERVLENVSTYERWKTFHKNNPHVYQLLRKYALDLVNAGRKRIGIKALFERLRWDYAVGTSLEYDDFKLNNNYAPIYARFLMELEPRLAGAFEIRSAPASSPVMEYDERAVSSPAATT